ncbi:MAG TPA: 50S ribosomal protein L22 [Alphaproteobacteria bacterium]|nr:50S ribosomal protein L22 [Alphaproteobacteria bacterium]
MAKHNYAYQKSEENIAKAVGRNLNVSPKQGTEICGFIRGRTVVQAKVLLHQAIAKKVAIPFKRFTNGLGHKPGMSAGRFHPKACELILKVLESAEANAKNKGYNSNDLKIVHSAMQIGAKNMHYGRKRRSIFKNSNIEIVVQEVKGLSGTKKKSTAKTDAPKVEKKTVKKAPKAAEKETKTEHAHAGHENHEGHSHASHEHNHEHKKVEKDN